jgi:nucleoside-diphosphate-sugar epimerase
MMSNTRKIALIGYTGFVGSTILSQIGEEDVDLYRSTNIDSIRNKSYDTVICAGAPGQKWLANQKPVEDAVNLSLMSHNIAKVDYKRMALISTVDVYGYPVGVDENSTIDPGMYPGNHYGNNRFHLENILRNDAVSKNAAYLILRLPGLVGKGLRKNALVDLANNRTEMLEKINPNSEFQFYDVGNLVADINECMNDANGLYNISCEPVRIGDVAEQIFGITLTNTSAPVVKYDMRSINTNAGMPYMYCAQYTMTAIKKYADFTKSLNQ